LPLNLPPCLPTLLCCVPTLCRSAFVFWGSASRQKSKCGSGSMFLIKSGKQNASVWDFFSW
jgi:hypothetical protein